MNNRANTLTEQHIQDTFEAFEAVRLAEDLTAEELRHLIGQAGFDHAPLLLYRAWHQGKIDETTLQAVIDDVWSLASDPNHNLDEDKWRVLFQAAGRRERHRIVVSDDDFHVDDDVEVEEMLDSDCCVPTIRWQRRTGGGDEGHSSAAAKVLIDGPTRDHAGSFFATLAPTPAEPMGIQQAAPRRRARLTRASDIPLRPVVWAWAIDGIGRIPAGALTIAAGREGTGKSTFGIWLAAQVTRGTLPGSYFGQPRDIFYVAVEDSWSQTIGPRLQAAEADLDRVYRLDVVTSEDDDLLLSLPVDNQLLEAEIHAHGVGLVVLDPLMSVIGENIDINQTRRVRSILDPIVKIADRTGAVILGIAHFNKSSGTDAASLLSGSHAFRDVPRAIFGFARDEQNESRVMSQVKNSLGRDDLPSFSYRIEGATIETPGGPAETSRLVLRGISERSVHDVLQDGRGDEDARTERDEAGIFIRWQLTTHGGSMPASDVIEAGRDAGISEQVIKKARMRSGIKTKRNGFGTGASWVWSIDSPEESIDSGTRSMLPMESMTTVTQINQAVSADHDDTPHDRA